MTAQSFILGGERVDGEWVNDSTFCRNYCMEQDTSQTLGRHIWRKSGILGRNCVSKLTAAKIRLVRSLNIGSMQSWETATVYSTPGSLQQG